MLTREEYKKQVNEEFKEYSSIVTGDSEQGKAFSKKLSEGKKLISNQNFNHLKYDTLF